MENASPVVRHVDRQKIYHTHVYLCFINIFQPVVRIYDIPDNTFETDEEDDSDESDDSDDEEDDDDGKKLLFNSFTTVSEFHTSVFDIRHAHCYS